MFVYRETYIIIIIIINVMRMNRSDNQDDTVIEGVGDVNDTTCTRLIHI